MPFEHAPQASMRIAVIGGGISGMGAAQALADQHRVTLFEQSPRLGGHARTVLAGQNGDQPVDTGFIVFNRVNYPNLVALFERLDVPVTETEMGFSTSLGGGAFEYSLCGLGGIFAQKRNLADPRFWGMIRDILRFNARAAATVQPGMSLGDLLRDLRLGDWFRDRYLLPFSGAIWSTPPTDILEFPADALVRFFENHALLHHTGQHQWYTVRGGSVEYVRRLEHALRLQGVDLRLGAPVHSVRRTGGGVQVMTPRGVEAFDQVIFATHTDQALALLADATAVEQSALGAIPYAENTVVLHKDPGQMPRRGRCWAAWNYTEPQGPRPDKIGVTYWMNALQPIPKSDPMFVTLNPARQIRQDLIYDQASFAHPVYTAQAPWAQALIRSLNGTNNTWFCGAWMRNGFHEDGLSSGLEVARALQSRAAPVLAAE